MPATRNKMASKMAEDTFNTLFHAGSSKLAAVAGACAILSSMLLILALFAMSAAGQTADLVVENARIYTGNSSSPQGTFMAVRGAKIVHVGDTAPALIGPATRRIDAQGSTIIPGFIDSHAHLAGLGDLLESINLRGVKSIESIAEMVREARRAVSKGEWIRGRAWDQTNWGGEFPTADPLTQAAPEHPVYLTRVDGHAAWVNRKALQIAGITRDTPDPDGGKIIRAADGEPTGVLIDRAQGLVSSKMPPPSRDQTERRLARAAKECARLGLTGIHDAGVGQQEIESYRTLIDKGQLPVRVYAMIGGRGDLWRSYLDRGPEIGEYLTIRSIKLMADGAMGSRGAAFWQPYSDDPRNTGLLLMTKDQIESVARDAVSRGFQVNTHAIGDRANRTVLEAYAAVLGGKNDRRFRIEHAQVISLPDFKLFADNSVIASIQSTHATSDMRWAAARLGPDRLKGAWAAQRFLNAGVSIANGSDFPVEDANPLWGFYAAVSRQDHAGQPPAGFLPDQKLTPEEALRSWTVGPAYAAFEEDAKGTLQPGKFADFVMLSRDIMTSAPAGILRTRVIMTVLGGKIVYRE
jgi:predicted amidohydrolase YtcJ